MNEELLKQEITRKCITGEDFSPEEQKLVLANAAYCIVEQFKDHPHLLQFIQDSLERFIEASKE